jgi:hypothetical protein
LDIFDFDLKSLTSYPVSFENEFMSKRRIDDFHGVHWFALGMLLVFFSPAAAFAQLIHDGSFETAPTAQVAGNVGWTICKGEPDLQVLDGFGGGIYGVHTPAANGQRYLGMLDTDFALQEAVGQSVAIEAGTYFFGHVALFRSTAHQNWNGTGQLQLWGGQACSDRRELLWSSGSVHNLDAWQYYPIEFHATHTHAWLSLVVVLDAGSGQMTYLAMDDFFLDNSILGLQFLNITAKPLADAVALDWETSPLTDATTFAAQWSADGQTFAEVTRIQGLVGQSQFAISHTPPQPSGRQYYRIQALGRSGSTTMSEVITTTLTTRTSLQVYPNPAKDHIALSLGADVAELQTVSLYDLQGRKVLQFECGGHHTTFALPSNLPNGSYHLAVQIKGNMLSHRLIIAR